MSTTTTPAPAPTTDVAAHHKRSWLGGLLPLIGTFLFLGATIIQFAGGAGEHWGPTLVSNAVVYLIGWAGVGAGVSHIFFGKRISRTIGFEQSPYEFEVGFADLTMGIVALMSVYYSPDFALAIIFMSSIYRVLCGIGHIRSMIRDHNFAINNTLILFTNFVVPAFLIVAFYAWGQA